MNAPLSGIIAAAALFITSFSTPQSVPVLTHVSYSLANRYANKSVNEVFQDNIPLTVAYLGGVVKEGTAVNWDTVTHMKEVHFTLKPGETFAFHDAVLDKYKNKIALTTNAHFNSEEGFKSDGWLVGDGVCHLASFLYVAAKNAGLEVEAPTAHDFAVIPNIQKKDGVSIYSESTLQNLYITNNRRKPVVFTFEHTEQSLTIKVEEI